MNIFACIAKDGGKTSILLITSDFLFFFGMQSQYLPMQGSLKQQDLLAYTTEKSMLQEFVTPSIATTTDDISSGSSIRYLRLRTNLWYLWWEKIHILNPPHTLLI
jgi:hypothetical protein